MHVVMVTAERPAGDGPATRRWRSFERHLPNSGVRCTAVDAADAPAMATADRPNVLLASMPPFGQWRDAVALGERIGAPVVFDLRTPWALDGTREHASRWHWWRERRELRRMLRRADGVIANTAECRELLLLCEPSLADEQVVTITDGWERDEFAATPTTVEPGRTLKLLHAGSFRCEPWLAGSSTRSVLDRLKYRPEPIQLEGQTPRPLLAAIRSLRDRGEPAGDELRLQILGPDHQALRRCVAESDAADAVELLGDRDRDEAVAALVHADALFLTMHGLPPGRRSRIVPDGLYDGLAAGRPILAGLPDGDARRLITSSPHAFVAAPTDVEALAMQLTRLHTRWRDGAVREPAHVPDLNLFERRERARMLAVFLRHVAAKHQLGSRDEIDVSR